MAITLGELASILKADIPSHHRDQEITGIKTLEEATGNEVSFYSSDKYRSHLNLTKACAVILAKNQADIASYNWIPIKVDNVPLAISAV